MLPLDYVLAVALLTASPAGCTPCGVSPEFATVRPTIQSLAVAWELLDPHELRFMLTRPEDFHSDLKLLRQRYHDLVDAPPVHDCMRFPARELINDLLTFNRAYRQHLDNRQGLEPGNYWALHETLLEVDRLYRLWDLVRDARSDYYYITVRRQALKKLRDTVGYQAYYSGRMPPHVPLWRFARID